MWVFEVGNKKNLKNVNHFDFVLMAENNGKRKKRKGDNGIEKKKKILRKYRIFVGRHDWKSLS